MNELIILRGVPGAGKSEFADELYNLYTSAGLSSIIACADDYFMMDGVYIFDKQLLGDAHKSCKAIANSAIESGINRVIIANTNTTNKEVNPYIQMAKKNNYKIRSLIVENRHGNENIHGVPILAIHRMKGRFQVSL